MTTTRQIQTRNLTRNKPRHPHPRRQTRQPTRRLIHNRRKHKRKRPRSLHTALTRKLQTRPLPRHDRRRAHPPHFHRLPQLLTPTQPLHPRYHQGGNQRARTQPGRQQPTKPGACRRGPFDRGARRSSPPSGLGSTRHRTCEDDRRASQDRCDKGNQTHRESCKPHDPAPSTSTPCPTPSKTDE
jgi:hypothetical protein